MNKHHSHYQSFHTSENQFHPKPFHTHEKIGSDSGVSSEFCENFKSIFFTEHLWTTASEVIKVELTINCFQINITQNMK